MYVYNSVYTALLYIYYTNFVCDAITRYVYTLSYCKIKRYMMIALNELEMCVLHFFLILYNFSYAR